VFTHTFHLLHQPWVVGQVLSHFAGEGTKAQEVSWLTQGVDGQGGAGPEAEPVGFPATRAAHGGEELRAGLGLASWIPPLPIAFSPLSL